MKLIPKKIQSGNPYPSTAKKPALIKRRVFFSPFLSKKEVLFFQNIDPRHFCPRQIVEHRSPAGREQRVAVGHARGFDHRNGVAAADHGHRGLRARRDGVREAAGTGRERFHLGVAERASLTGLTIQAKSNQRAPAPFPSTDRALSHE